MDTPDQADLPTVDSHSVWKTDKKHKHRVIPDTLPDGGLHCEQDRTEVQGYDRGDASNAAVTRACQGRSGQIKKRTEGEGQPIAAQQIQGWSLGPQRGNLDHSW